METVWANLALVAIILITFYLALIRPNQIQERRRREMLDGLRAGDRVVTVGGLYGDIVKLTEDTARLRIADGVEVTIVRSAVKYLVDDEGMSKGQKKRSRRS